MDPRTPNIPGLGRLGWVLEALATAIIGFITVTILIGIILLLVRFLLVATRAAQLYVEKNEPPDAPKGPLAGAFGPLFGGGGPAGPGGGPGPGPAGPRPAGPGPAGPGPAGPGLAGPGPAGSSPAVAPPTVHGQGDAAQTLPIPRGETTVAPHSAPVTGAPGSDQPDTRGVVDSPGPELSDFIPPVRRPTLPRTAAQPEAADGARGASRSTGAVRAPRANRATGDPTPPTKPRTPKAPRDPA